MSAKVTKMITPKFHSYVIYGKYIFFKFAVKHRVSARERKQLIGIFYWVYGGREQSRETRCGPSVTCAAWFQPTRWPPLRRSRPPPSTGTPPPDRLQTHTRQQTKFLQAHWWVNLFLNNVASYRWFFSYKVDCSLGIMAPSIMRFILRLEVEDGSFIMNCVRFSRSQDKESEFSKFSSQ